MSFELVLAVKDLLEKGFEHVRFRHTESDPGEYSAPQFFIGAIPARRKGNDPGNDERQSDYPYIVIRAASGEDRQDESIASVEILCGIYTAQGVEPGENDIMNMVMRCRRVILESQILSGRFLLDWPLTYSLGDERGHHAQPHPYYEGVIKTKWQVPAFDRVCPVDEETGVYGNFG
jgi:hypothetical protein